MFKLSRLLRFHLVDAAGSRARLADVAVYPLDVDYPPVSELIFRNGERQPRALAWSPGMRVDVPAKIVRVPDLAQAAPLDMTDPPQSVWLGRDVLDAIIIDLQRRRVTRADELYCRPTAGGWRCRRPMWARWPSRPAGPWRGLKRSADRRGARLEVHGVSARRPRRRRSRGRLLPPHRPPAARPDRPPGPGAAVPARGRAGHAAARQPGGRHAGGDVARAPATGIRGAERRRARCACWR